MCLCLGPMEIYQLWAAECICVALQVGDRAWKLLASLKRA